MGLLLSRENQGWVGHLVWTGTLVVACTFIPAAKWFGTYEVGRGGACVGVNDSCTLFSSLLPTPELFWSSCSRATVLTASPPPLFNCIPPNRSIPV